jgi:hypothetical protein
MMALLLSKVGLVPHRRPRMGTGLQSADCMTAMQSAD